MTMFRVSVLVLLAGGMLCLAKAGKAPDAPAKASDGKQPEPASQPGKVKKADNSYCLVCHANYEEEKLSAKHAKAGVGCETCHGKSSKHSSDEDGLTPPEIMYPKEKIASACLACHKAEKIKDEDEDHKKVFDKKGNVLPGAKSCTECHGKHKMKVRTRIWDKSTGKLLSDDGVRMMNKAPQTQPSDKK